MVATLTDAQQAFYSTSAQVIPVLILAMALEFSTPRIVRDFLSLLPNHRATVATVSLISLALGALMLTGELLALGTLEDDKVDADTHT